VRGQQQLQHHRRTVRRNLNQIFGSIGVRSTKKVTSASSMRSASFARVFIQHIGQPRAPVLQRLLQAHQLRGNRRRLRSAQPHNPDAAAPRRRGDGGDGRGCYL
jgi:hypothetical protein